MSQKVRHADVKFSVTSGTSFSDRVEHLFNTFDEAAAFAMTIAATGADAVTLDVLVWSVGGARALAGDDGVERYLEDPEASVFERLEIKVNNVGRVP